MSQTNESANTVRKRLLSALSTDSDLTCEQAEELVPLLVQAEAAGEDGSADPQFAALFRHFDTCENCALLYATLASDLAEMITDPGEPVQISQNTPRFFEVDREAREADREYRTRDWVLRVWNSAIRMLEFIVQPQALIPRQATLGDQPDDQNLFSDRIPDLAGAPSFSVTLQHIEEQVVVRVELHDLRATVRIAAGDETWEQQTDERGIADFAGIPRGSISQGLRITCNEIVS